MKSLEFLSDSPPVLNTPQNRNSSFCKSSQGYVIHSGVHRSTAFISKDEHADGFFAFQYWSRQGQIAINAFIEATIEGLELEACEESSCRKSLADWTITRKGKQAGGALQAISSHTIPVHIGALTWRHLHSKCINS